MILYTTITVSVALNIFLLWYVVKLLRKFLFISSTISDLYLTAKAFQVFVKTLYGMNNYHGEPMVQELIHRIKEMLDEIEAFREVFEPTLDIEIEEELNGAETEEEAPPQAH